MGISAYYFLFILASNVWKCWVQEIQTAIISVAFLSIQLSKYLSHTAKNEREAKNDEIKIGSPSRQESFRLVTNKSWAREERAFQDV